MLASCTNSKLVGAIDMTDIFSYLPTLIESKAVSKNDFNYIVGFLISSESENICSPRKIPVSLITPKVRTYTENLSNVTPIGVQTSALDSPKGIVSHDLHVVLTHYPHMTGDASETEIVVPRLVGHIEVDGTLGGGGGAVSPNARYLQITFDNFPTDATNYGSSNVAVVTSGSNPTYLGTCFVPMTLGSTLSNAVIVSLPTVGDSGTLASPTIYFS